MSVKSILETITESLTPDGRLPHPFSLLTEETPPNELRFMPGAKDGIGIFHAGRSNPEKAAEEIVRLLKDVWKAKKPTFAAKLFSKGHSNQNAHEKIAKLIHENGTLSVVDPVLNAIRKDHKGIDIQNLIQYACGLAFESDDEELVKLGIALLGLLDLTNLKDMIDKLLTLALYEEFTLFVIVALSGCDNANALVFEIARKVDGWGKIHAVERLQPETEEIRDWLLRKGCENAVMDAYLGLECATKGDLINTMRLGSLDEELFEGVSIIINALLDEGPTDGISAYEYAEEALRLYLNMALSHAVEIKHLWYVLGVQSWLEDSEISSKEELLSLCSEITTRQNWQELIQSILALPGDDRFFFAVNTARRLDIDVSPQIFEAVKANPIKHSGYLSSLYKNPAYAEELTGLYETILPLDKMEKGMGDYLFGTTYTAEHGCLDFVLQELGAYPNMGECFIRAALLSPVVRERHGATRALVEWSKQLGQPLKDISPGLFSVLSQVAPTEINDEVKERSERLLAGICE